MNPTLPGEHFERENRRFAPLMFPFARAPLSRPPRFWQKGINIRVPIWDGTRPAVRRPP